MTATKLLTLLVTAMLVSAGAGTVVAMDETTTAANEPTDTPTGDDPDDSDSESSLNLGVDATLENDTVDMTVTDNGTGIENVSVSAEGEFVGETDANGSLTFETNASEQLNVTLSGDEWSAEYVYDIENGSLDLVGSDVDLPEEDGQMGPNENASENAKTVWGTIQEWLDGNRDTNLGKMIQAALGHDNGNAGQANGHEAGQAGSNAKHEKKPDHAGKDADGKRTENPGKQKAAEKKGGQQTADKANGHEKKGNGKPDVGHDEIDDDDGETDDDDGEESDE